MEERKRNTLHELEVTNERLLEHLVSKDATIRDITHQQFNNDIQLVNRLEEARCRCRRRCSSDSQLEVSMGIRVVELNSFDSSKVVVITSKLVVGCRSGERGLGYEFIGLVVKGVRDIRTE